MIDFTKIIIDGSLISLLSIVFLLMLVRVNPRLMLQDYPKDVQAAVPPKSEQEKRQSLILGLPFLLVLFGGPFVSALTYKMSQGGDVPFLALFTHAFAVIWFFNIFDWLVLDWLIFCTITPRFVVIPGTEGMPGYKQYAPHFRGFLIGTVFSVVIGLISATIIYWLS